MFHLLGAESMEEALFTGYVRQVRARHPDAALPALYMADGLLADADRMRKNIGDEVFFAGLNGGDDVSADRGRGCSGPMSGGVAEVLRRLRRRHQGRSCGRSW